MEEEQFCRVNTNHFIKYIEAVADALENYKATNYLGLEYGEL